MTGRPTALTVAPFEERVLAAASRAGAATAAAWARVAHGPIGGYPEVAGVLSIVEGLDGGKYLRPRLAAAAYLGFGGTDNDVLDALGAGLQSLHLGLCIHDDLIDGDELRHGRFNVAGTVRRSDLALGHGDAAARRQGTAIGLLAGDLAVNVAQQSFLGAPASAAVRLALITEALACMEETIAGEILDVRSELYPLDSELAIVVAELKTAAYSLVLPLRLGAIAAGITDPEILDGIRELGRHLGIAYQLVDDDLGLFGDPERTGKSNISDLREGKRTEVLRLAWTRGREQDRRELLAGVGRSDLGEAEADRLRQIVIDTGARQACLDVVARHTEKAKDLARQHFAHLTEPLAPFVLDLADYCRYRDR